MLNFIFVFVLFFANDDHYKFQKAPASQAESACQVPLALTQNRTCASFWPAKGESCQSPQQTSFERSIVCRGNQKNGLLPVALQLRQAERQTTYALPHLPCALESWNSPQQCSEKSTSPTTSRRSVFNMELAIWPTTLKTREEKPKSELLLQGGQREKKFQRRRQRQPWERCPSVAICNPVFRCCNTSLAFTRDQCHFGSDPSGTIIDSGFTCRAPHCSAQAVPRHLASPRRHSEGCGKVRQGDYQGPHNGLEQSLEASWESCETIGYGEGCAHSPSSELAQTSPRLSGQLAKAATTVQGSAEGLQQPVGKSPPGAHHCAQTPSELEQAGCCDRSANFLRDRRSQYGECRHGQLHLRSRSSSFGSTGAGKPPAEHSSCSRGGASRSDIRRRDGSEKQKATIHGALWRARESNWRIGRCGNFLTLLVSIGSAALCPNNWNGLREPFDSAKVPGFADAYRFHGDCGAACKPDLDHDSLNYMIRCHSIHWEPSFLGESSALAAATILRNEILGWGFDAPLRTTSFSTLLGLRPILRRAHTPHRCRQKAVTFQNFAEIIEDCFPPILEPHCDPFWNDNSVQQPSFEATDEGDDFSLMERAPRAIAQPDSSSSFVDSDLETHMPTSPSSFDEQHAWTSVQVYDLKSNHAHGRVRILPQEANFAELCRMLGYTHHAVADIFSIQPAPSDLRSANISPHLILAHDDLLFGDHRTAVLVDVELHGSSIESTIEIDRYTTMLPSPIHRSLLLRIAGVSQYCALRKNRCLVWHRGTLVPLQQKNTFDLQHGDYLRIAVPPFEPECISTYYAVRASQHGLTQRQIVHRHQRNPDADELFPEIEAAQRQPERGDHDFSALLQLHQDLPLGSDEHVLQAHKTGECSAPLFTAQTPDTFLPREVPRPDDANWPSWYSSLHRAFQEQAATACEEEGPIAFVTTWYLRGPGESVSEESRVLRLDHYHDLWRQDLVELWNDKIIHDEVLNIEFVHPEPPRRDTSWTIGHVILHQIINRPFVPALVALNFLTDRRTGLNFAAVSLQSPTSAFRIRDTCRLARICIDRRCDLHANDRVYQQDEFVHIWSGQCLISTFTRQSLSTMLVRIRLSHPSG